ncbi:MAG: hypothetical protein ABI759_02810 [Candidatus Solibacter sp.]
MNPVESFFWAFERDLDGAFRVLILVRLEGCIEGEFLRAALRRLQIRHPKLRARLSRSGQFRYELPSDIAPIPFAITDYEGVEFPWRDQALKLLQTALPAEGPFARVHVLRSRSRNYCELLFSAPHAIADGRSTIAIAGDLLAEYAAVESGAEAAAAEPLPPVSVVRVRVPGSTRDRLRLVERFQGLRKTEALVPLMPLPTAQGVSPQSQWMHWVFSPKETLAIVRRCRKEKVSLGSALMAAVFCALMECLPAPRVSFKWQFPFDVRESLHGPAGPVTPHDLGCFMSNMNGLSAITRPYDVWEVARHAQGEIQLFSDLGGPAFSYRLASRLYTFRAVLGLFFRSFRRARTSSGPRETLLATNYGVLGMRDSYGSLRPRECTLLFKKEITGPSLVVESLVLAQRLNVGFFAGDLDSGFWERVHPAVHAQLTAIMRDGGPSYSPNHEGLEGQRTSVAPHE